VPLAQSEGNGLCFCARSVFVFSFDATAEQRLDGFLPNLHQQMSLPCYSLIVVPHENGPHPKKSEAPNIHFLE